MTLEIDKSQKQIKFDGVDWAHFDLKTGEKINGGRVYFSNSNRLVGPGVSNILIARLKKGEVVEQSFEALNLRATFQPVRSRW